jgi:CheY-like chemotaxis protein
MALSARGVPVMATSSSSVATILIVEDNDATREGLAYILRKAGYEVATASNGRQGLDCLRSGRPRPDLVVLDMLLPVLDGWHFLEELRQWSRPLKIPILITTATILSRDWAAQHGCAGFLRKPVKPEQLLCEIKELLGR